MHIPQKFIHDRVVLLLIAANSLLAALTLVTTALRLQGSQGEGYVIQYRANLGLNAFKVGGISSVLSIMLFVVVILGLHILLSIRVYSVRRYLALTILAFGVLLLLLSLIISNSLLLLAR